MEYTADDLRKAEMEWFRENREYYETYFHECEDCGGYICEGTKCIGCELGQDR